MRYYEETEQIFEQSINLISAANFDDIRQNTTATHGSTGVNASLGKTKT